VKQILGTLLIVILGVELQTVDLFHPFLVLVRQILCLVAVHMVPLRGVHHLTILYGIIMFNRLRMGRIMGIRVMYLCSGLYMMILQLGMVEIPTERLNLTSKLYRPGWLRLEPYGSNMAFFS